MKLRFLGAAGTVTGAKFLLDAPGQRLLLDCGLYQGAKPLRERNWAPLPVPADSISRVLLSHAHLDHSGYLPGLVRAGFQGPILCSAPTRDLCGVLLMDSAHLQEEDARIANQRGSSRHHPALPLYTSDDARHAIGRLDAVPLQQPVALGDGLSASFTPVGHLLGACAVSVRHESGTTLTYSGDVGRHDDVLLPAPAQVQETDVLLIESTYGDRLHLKEDVEARLADVITRTAARGGSVLFPAFAVGRAQALMWHLHQLKLKGAIPDLPVFLDSPMAAEATRITLRHSAALRPEAQDLEAACEHVQLVGKAEESMRLVGMSYPRVIISASGMATGGRVLHHLQAMAPDPRHSIVFPGFQVPGTRGDRLLRGERAVKIFGEMVPVRAEVSHLEGVSGHADADGLIAWLRGFKRPPHQTWVVHGEPDAASALRGRIADELGWPAQVAAYNQEIEC